MLFVLDKAYSVLQTINTDIDLKTKVLPTLVFKLQGWEDK